MSPSTALTTPEGKQNRAKLLRAWVETSAWLADYRKRFRESNSQLILLYDVDSGLSALELKNYTPRDLYVSVMAAREMYQTAIGAHNDQSEQYICLMDVKADKLCQFLVAVYRTI